MDYYHFRLTDPEITMLESCVNWMCGNTRCLVELVVSETSKNDKLHIHAVLGIQNKSTFFQQFHKKFENRWHGNKSFTCETLRKEKENNYIYLCKGTRNALPNVMYKAGISDEMIKQYHDKYWEDKPLDKEHGVKLREKKSQIKTWSQELTATIRNKYPGKLWIYDADHIDLLWAIVTDALGSASKKLSAFIVRDLVMGQLNALNPTCVGIKKQMRNQAFPDLFGE